MHKHMHVPLSLSNLYFANARLFSRQVIRVRDKKMKENEMKNIMIHRSKLALLLILTVTFIARSADAQVVCNKFKLVTEIKGSTLDLSVDTDLPDNTVVIVHVSRTYLTDDLTTCLIDYLEERSTIGKWKSKHRIFLDSEKWKAALKAKQKLLSKLGASFDVASISDKITVGMTVSNFQFRKRNSNLTGKAVTISDYGTPVVDDKVEIDYPLDSPFVGKSPFPSLDPLGLEIGQTYIVSKQTPLMPSHSPADPIAALQKMKPIPKGGAFKVLNRFNKRGNPWYRVIAFDQRKKQIGTGWINSTALLGQELKTYK